MPSETAPGALALVGSGEYTDTMNATDAYLLDTLGGPAGARVVLLPTASGLEDGSPARWNEMGRRHFMSLGVTDIRASMILTRADASDPTQLDLLRGGTFFYFSGGSPGQITEVLRGTPAWEILHEAHVRGAVLAGCSAGAMAFGGQTLSLRRVLTASAPSSPADARGAFTAALGIVPHLITFPHFDRMAGFVGQQAFTNLLASIPQEYTAVGVDEDTALVRVVYNGAESPARWQVMGRQTVTVFAPGAAPRVLREGDEVDL